MKKILAIFLTATMLILCAGCSTQDTSSANSTIEISQSTESAPEWKQFLAEYESWVDSYIELAKKSKANPTDFSLLTEYTGMLKDLTEWTSKTEDMRKELESASPAEIAEYSKELSRIALKLTEIN